MIKVLHIISSLSFDGGVQNMLYNYYSNINQSKIRFDFVVHGTEKGGLEERFKAMGSNVFHVTPKRTSLAKNLVEINSVIRKGNYDVVHVHQNLSSGLSLLLASVHQVPVRICHSHGCQDEMGFIRKARNSVLRAMNNVFATYRFACGQKAGVWLFGKDWGTDNSRDLIMYNALDLEKFQFDAQTRCEYRSKLELVDKFVLIQVGRLSQEKNQQFSINLMDKLRLIKPNSVLLIVGDGSMDNSLRSMVNGGLEDHIRFLGVRTDIWALLNAADVMLLPSKNEGLGMVAIEAQSCGLRVVASDAVPKEVALTSQIEFLSLDDDLSVWVNEVLKVEARDSQRSEVKGDFTNYSIKTQSSKYEQWLINTVKNTRAI